jgi:hypothetical protein
MADSFTIEVLEDGTLKINSGKISPQNHMSAEAFLRNVAQTASGGGTQTRKHKAGIIGAAMHAVQHAMGSGHSH